MVWGYASTEAEDDQGETVTRAALAEALADYLRFANIREMHQMSAVGVAEEAAIDDKGLYVAVRIVDPRAWDKVTAGVYKGFSIGGRVKSRDPADHTVITGLSLTEISLVDRPANPEAVFDCWKAEGGQSMADAAAAGSHPVQLWHCGVAAHRHAAKAGAVQCLARRAKDGDDVPENDVVYADPGYQPDGAERYPIDRENHIRTAWAYIHQPDNAARYTEAQLAHIKARIVAAWQEKIDPAGPPATAIGGPGKAIANEGLRKGFGDLGRIGQILGDLDWLCGFLRGMTEAGIALPSGLPPGDSKGIHAGDIAKALAAEIVPRLDALAKRVEDIAATPLPPQTLAHGYAGISKRDDGGGPAGDVVAALSRMSDDERTLVLIKAAHANPIRPAGIPRGQ
jgi:HK97 family phage prohead protease